MDKELLRKILNEPYDRVYWQSIIEFAFPNVSYFSNPPDIACNNEKVDSLTELGVIRLADGKNLALFEIRVKENVKIARNRVELRNIVAKYIDQEKHHGVLAIYEQGADEYRFTFTARESGFDDSGSYTERETDAKRFTYVLGKNESCRTARDRFWELSAIKDKALMKDVEQAFSVERLSKEFFTKYKAHYSAFVDYLAASNYKITAFGADDKRIRDFAKVLLGRIVFLHFVQKKGWLGASDTDFTDGDKNFMLNLWNQTGKDESFYTAWLSSLFFGALNKEGRPGQAFTMPAGNSVCVPFLGGGLFEKDRNEPEVITFPPQLFDNLFNFFGEYNFTIDENDPYENEVGIDPEMLGHIFENLLEDNKDKGAFYTPKPIVKYMCRESLIQYLLTQLEQNGVVESGSEAQKELEEKLSNFVKKYEAGDLIAYDNLLAKALHTIKVCDPAIGSGAFPMGILNEMVMLINVLHRASPDVVEQTWQMDNWQPATVKKHIIQNSIYGVDIEKGAVDIARLRFWLSLVLDEEKPSALPSLDYKIVVGNSLVSKLGDDIIDIDWTLNQKSNELFDEELARQKKELLKKLISHQRRFYTAQGEKKELAAKIRNLKIDLLINQLALMIDKQNIAVEPKPEDYRNKPKAKFTEAYNRYLQCMGWQQQIEKLKSLKAKPDIPLEFFDWKLNFPEVMNEQVAEKAGFDVVIGNPPYVNVEAIDKSIKDNIKKFRTAHQKYDLYVLFYERAIDLTKTNGQLSYISSNKFLSQGYGFLLRNEFLNYYIHQIINFNFDIFEAATVRTCIFHLQKTKISNNKIKIIDVGSPKDEAKFKNLHYSYLDQKIFKELEENNFRLNLTEEKINILEKVSKLTLKVEDIFSVNYGLRPSSEKLGLKKEAFIHSNNPSNNYKKYFEGKDMGYWRIKAYSYLDYRPDVMYNAMFPELFENNKLVGLRTLSDIGKLRFIFDDEHFYCNDSVVILILWHLLSKIKNQTIYRTINDSRISNSKRFNYYYVQGILNSKLIKFYVNELLYDGTHFYPNHMKSLPIRDIDIENQKEISGLVEQIHKMTLENNLYEIPNLENKIDNLVYRLYDLTYAEVKVIDPDFGMSEGEYENIKLITNTL
jgi:adenine-specific DNA-methyltransferase